MSKRWIQKAAPKKGALHRQLNVPSDRPLPPNLLRDIERAEIGAKVHGHRVTTLLKRRVNFAMNARSWRK